MERCEWRGMNLAFDRLDGVEGQQERPAQPKRLLGVGVVLQQVGVPCNRGDRLDGIGKSGAELIAHGLELWRA